MFSRRFAVALSFPGKHRRFVRNVADELKKELGEGRVFFDDWYRTELYGSSLDLKLKQIYRDEADLVVPFFSEYYKSSWCQIEWHAIRVVLMERRKDNAVVPVHIDGTVVEGWEGIDYGIRKGRKTGRQIAEAILDVYRQRSPDLQRDSESVAGTYGARLVGDGDIRKRYPKTAYATQIKKTGEDSMRSAINSARELALHAQKTPSQSALIQAFQTELSPKEQLLVKDLIVRSIPEFAGGTVGIFNVRPAVNLATEHAVSELESGLQLRPLVLSSEALRLHQSAPTLEPFTSREQIERSYIVWPHVRAREQGWVSDRDLLLLGLPFCGKTSLLTYLAEKAATIDSKLLPVRVTLHERSRESIRAADAVVDIDRWVKQSDFGRERRLVLIIDDIHRRELFPIAQRLMQGSRSWVVWATARIGEYGDLLNSGESNPWTEDDTISDAAPLVGEHDAGEFFESIIRPLMERERREPVELESVKSAINSVKDRTARFLIHVWQEISNHIHDVGFDGPGIVNSVPSLADDVVQAIWPNDRIGIDALVVTDILERPPWDLLATVLVSGFGYEKELVANRLAQLERSLVLLRLDDPQYAGTATMYDPVRDHVRKPEQQSGNTESHVWEGVDSYLGENREQHLTSRSESIGNSWLQIAKLAYAAERYELATLCFDQAYRKLPQYSSPLALLMMSYSQTLRPGSGSEDSLKTCRQAVTESRQLNNEKLLASALGFLGLLLRSQPEPDWTAAIEAYREVLSLLPSPEQQEDRAAIMDELSYCLTSQPVPDWQAAVAVYRHEANRLAESGQEPVRAIALANAARLQQQQPEPDWSGAIDAYHEAIDMVDDKARPDLCAELMNSLAICHWEKPGPDWGEAIRLLRGALQLVGADEYESTRLLILYNLGLYLSSQPEPDWTAAIDAYREVLPLLESPELKENRTVVLDALVNCLTRQPESDWQAAVAVYRLESDRLTEPGQASARAIALANVAMLLQQQPEPSWVGAIEAYRQAIDLVDVETQPGVRAGLMNSLAICLREQPLPDWDEVLRLLRDAVHLVAAEEYESTRSLVLYNLGLYLSSQPEPDWPAAIEAYREVLPLLQSPEQQEHRTVVLGELAYCLTSQSEPDWKEAVAVYRHEADRLIEPGQESVRAIVLATVAVLLQQQPEPDWVGAIDAYRQATDLIDGETQPQRSAELMNSLAICLREQPLPDWDEALRLLRDAVRLVAAEEYESTRSLVLYNLGLYLNSQPEPDWPEAIRAYTEVLPLLRSPEQQEHRTVVLGELAYCLTSQSEPDWEEAVAVYRREADRLIEPGEESARAIAMASVAILLQQQPEADWGAAIDSYHQAIDIIDGETQPDLRAGLMNSLAISLREQPDPDWSESIRLLRDAVLLVAAEEYESTRSLILHNLGLYLSSQPEPDWTSAIEAYREVLPLLQSPEQQEYRATALDELAYCLSSQPDPDWTAAIAAYREVLPLLQSPEQQEHRAAVLEELVYCLSSQSEPDWREAVALYRTEVDRLIEPGQESARTVVMANVARLLYQQSEPDWSGAVDAYREVLPLLESPEQQEHRAAALGDLAYCLSHLPKPDWNIIISTQKEAIELRRAGDDSLALSAELFSLGVYFTDRPDPSWSEALITFQESLAELKDDVPDLNGLQAMRLNWISWIRGACPDDRYRDAKIAVSCGQQACILSEYRNGGDIDTLAAAHAESGNFAEAVKLERQAIELTDDESTQEEYRQRLRLYESGRPFRIEIRIK